MTPASRAGNCGTVVDGEASLDQMGAKILARIVGMVSGRRKKSEKLGLGAAELAQWHLGAISFWLDQKMSKVWSPSRMKVQSSAWLSAAISWPPIVRAASTGGAPAGVWFTLETVR